MVQFSFRLSTLVSIFRRENSNFFGSTRKISKGRKISIFFNDWSFKQSEFDKSWVEISEMIDASNLSYKGNKRCAKMGLPSAVLKRNKFGKKLN